MLALDKQKYLQILETLGLAAALTTLHRDRDALEFETFEGREGWNRENWAEMIDINQFSRELWDRASELDAPIKN